ISVVCPTSTPFTSVIAFSCPGLPSKGTPRSRARGLFCAATDKVQKSRAYSHIARLSLRIKVLQSCNSRLAVYETLMTRTYQRARTRRPNVRAERRKKMENWKKAVLAGSAGLAAILLLKGNRTGGLLFTGVALAALASEYPDTFADIRDQLPNYIERGTSLLEVA